MLGKLPLEVPPEELSIRARDIARSLGYTDEPAYIAAGFDWDSGYLARLRRGVRGSRTQMRQQWAQSLATPPWPLSFTYVASPTPLMPDSGNIAFAALHRTFPEAGRFVAMLDLSGRLLSVDRSPRAADLSRPIGGEPDWSALFRAAGLDMSRFAPANPEPRVVIADARVAWTGPYLGAGHIPVRIEAASFRGMVTHFVVLFSWSEPPAAERSNAPFFEIFVLAFAIVGLRHWKQGRADPRGAIRFGVYAFAVVLIATLLATFPRTGTAFAFQAGAIAALGYLAVEPWTRRLWPHAMITWARVLAGRWRDPVVGRDCLIAVACVSSNYAIQRIVEAIAVWFGRAPLPPQQPGSFGIIIDNLASGRVTAANVTIPFYYGLVVGMGVFFVFFIVNVMVRRKWLAALVACMLWFGGNIGVLSDWIAAMQWGLEFVFLLFLTLRFGLFASALFSCLSQLIDWSILTGDFGAWYGHASLAASLIIGALTLYAFRVSLGNTPLFSQSE